MIWSLSHSQAISLTSDGWTSGNNEAYITVTGHEITPDFGFNSFILATRELDVTHSGENIGGFVTEICQEFGIHGKTYYITTDNAANMGVAAQVSGLYRIRCFAHTLQLAVRDGLENVAPVQSLIKNARNLAKTVKKSTRLDKAIEKHQVQLGKETKGVLRDVQTRWNSSFIMLERLLEIQTDVVSVLHTAEFQRHKHLLLSDNQWELAEKIVPVLKQMTVATELLCSEKIPGITSYYPLAFRVIALMQVKPNDGGVVSELKTRISNGLRDRMLTGNYWETPPMIAAALDPNTKSLLFLTEDKRNVVYQNIQHELSNLPQELPQQDEPTDEPAAKKSAVSSLASFLGDEITNIDNTGEDVNEFQLYLETKITEFVDVMDWWKLNKNSFPKLARLARRYLSIQATSVPSERLFSAAGQTISKRRSALSSDTADKLLFLNKNMKMT